MQDTSPEAGSTLALSTKLEEEFVTPLTAIRGALEILRDHDDLEPAEKARFVENALAACGKLETGVRALGETVYAASKQTAPPAPEAQEDGPFADRLHPDEQTQIFEIDFNGHVFNGTPAVNAFYDAIENAIGRARHKWYFLVNVTGLSVWPEAWVSFAHRGKKINVNFSLGTARYVDAASGDAPADREIARSREEALGWIEQARKDHPAGPVPLDI